MSDDKDWLDFIEAVKETRKTNLYDEVDPYYYDSSDEVQRAKNAIGGRRYRMSKDLSKWREKYPEAIREVVDNIELAPNKSLSSSFKKNMGNLVDADILMPYPREGLIHEKYKDLGVMDYINKDVAKNLGKQGLKKGSQAVGLGILGLAGLMADSEDANPIQENSQQENIEAPWRKEWSEEERESNLRPFSTAMDNQRSAESSMSNGDKEALMRILQQNMIK